jgi:hypothetical protein
MPRSVFHVTVPCDDGHDEVYLFDHLVDVMRSLTITYSNMPLNMRATLLHDQGPHRWEFGIPDSKKPIVVIQRTILDGPTHL